MNSGLLNEDANSVTQNAGCPNEKTTFKLWVAVLSKLILFGCHS